MVPRFSQDPPSGGGVGVRTPVTATSTLPQSELLPRDAEGGAFTKSAVRPKTPPLTGNPGNAGAPDRLRRRERVSADVTLAASNHLSGALTIADCKIPYPRKCIWCKSSCQRLCSFSFEHQLLNAKNFVD